MLFSQMMDLDLVLSAQPRYGALQTATARGLDDVSKVEPVSEGAEWIYEAKEQRATEEEIVADSAPLRPNKKKKSL